MLNFLHGTNHQMHYKRILLLLYQGMTVTITTGVKSLKEPRVNKYRTGVSSVEVKEGSSRFH